MKILMSSVLLLSCMSALAADKTRKPSSSELGAGSYQCQNSDKEIIASFYIRKDGTSTKVDVISATDYSDTSGIEGCSMVSFKWIKSGKQVSNVECCPYGAN